MIPLPALLVMVAALLLLSAGPALSDDFAGTLPSHAHVYFGVPHAPHSHGFQPGVTSGDDVVNVSPNEAGTVVLGVITPPNATDIPGQDAAPWLHLDGDSTSSPEGLATPPLDQPPIS